MQLGFVAHPTPLFRSPARPAKTRTLCRPIRVATPSSTQYRISASLPSSSESPTKFASDDQSQQRPGWRKTATIAAAVLASVLFPGRSVVKDQKVNAQTQTSQEYCLDEYTPPSVSSHAAVRVNTAGTAALVAPKSPQLAFAESVQLFREKTEEVKNSLITALSDESEGSHSSHQAAVNDALVLLLTTVVIIPLMRRFKTSPILGFLAAGIVLGPNGLGLVRDVATSKALAELGVVFFLFEMGLELSTSKLQSLGADVFGLGTSQFLITTVLLSLAAALAGITTTTSIIIGAGLALSSSAFVLQLLSERGEIGTRFGRAGFGILLFQDLAVVPCLVLTPLLAGSGGAAAVGKAISIASGKAAVALALIWFMGKNFLQPVFRFVARAKSQEAFIAVILFTVLGTSSLTQVLGLSDTLGAFLAGVMLAETKYRHQIEADIKPFRGLLLGLFFITVGFSIDLNLLVSNFGTVFSLVGGLIAVKTAVITAAGVVIGMSLGSAVRTGLLLSQGGEFAFVIFGLAQGVGVLPTDLAQLLLLVVAITMGLTPFLAEMGRRIASKMESKRGLIGMRMEDADSSDARDFVMVAGWGRVGQSICELLDAKLVRYMAFDMSPTRVIDARNKGLPVYFGDACRPEVLRSAGVARARAVVITLDDPKAALQAVQNILREFPDLRVFCRARDSKQQRLLQAAGATAIVPELLEASLLLGGAVLLDYGTPMDEVNALIEETRQKSFNMTLNGATLRSQFGSLEDPELDEAVTEDDDLTEEESVEDRRDVAPSRRESNVRSNSDSMVKKPEMSSDGHEEDPDDIYATATVTPPSGIDSEEASSTPLKSSEEKKTEP